MNSKITPYQSKYVAYYMFLRRVEEENGLYPMNIPTGGGKTSAIADLYKTDGYEKITTYIANNRKNTRSSYKDHYVEMTKDKEVKEMKKYKDESLILYSNSDYIEEEILLTEENKSIMKNFFDALKQEEKKRGSLEKSRTDYQIIDCLVNGKNEKYREENRKCYKKLIELFSNRDKIKLQEDIKAEIEKHNKVCKNAIESEHIIYVGIFKKILSYILKTIIAEEIKIINTLLKDHHEKAEPKEIRKQARASVLKQIIEEEDFAWIKVFFPQMRLLPSCMEFEDRDIKKVKRIYMNIDKFLSPLDLVFPGYRANKGYQLDYLEGSIIITDEFDADFKRVLDVQLREVKERENFDRLEQFQNALSCMINKDENNLPPDKNIRKNFKSFKKYIEDTFIKPYHEDIRNSFKKVENEPSERIIFYNAYNAKDFLGTDYLFYYDYDINDSYDYNTWKFFNTTDIKYKENLTNNGVPVYSLSMLLKDIDIFYEKFIALIREIAIFYRKKDENTKVIMSIKEDREYLTDALNVFTTFNEQFSNFIILGARDVEYKLRRKDDEDKMTLPEDNPIFNGFNYYIYSDSKDNEYMRTAISKVNFDKTPEGFLLNLSKKATVIPLSATLDFETVYSNFLTSEIKKELGEGKYYTHSKEEDEELKLEYDKKTNNYHNINMKKEILKEKKGGDSYNTPQDLYFEKLIDDKRYDILSNKIVKNNLKKFILGEKKKEHEEIVDYYLTEGKRDEEKKENLKAISYHFECFKDLIYAFHLYIKEGGYSGLFLSNFNITYDEKSRIPKKLLNEVLDIIIKVESEEEIVYKYANASDYDKVFAKLKEKFNEGNKIVLFTTYQNIATGQNLTVEITNDKIKERLIEPNTNGIGSRDKIDFNSIYLGQITHLGITGWDAYKSNNLMSEVKVEYIYNLERAYALEFLEEGERRGKILNLLDHSLEKFKGYEYQEDKDKEILRVAIQAVGRLCRNNRKEKEILLMASSNVVNEKTKELLKNRMVLKEIEFLFDIESEDMLMEIAENIIPEAQYMSMEVYSHLEEIVKTIRDNEEDRLEYDSYRDYLKPTAGISPATNDLEKIPEKLKTFFIKTENPVSEIYTSNLEENNPYAHMHSTKYSKITRQVIGRNAPFIKELLTNSFIQDTLKRNKIEIPEEDEKYIYHPCLAYRNNICKGYMGEFFAIDYLKQVGFKLRELPFQIYEGFDSIIETSREDILFLIDFKFYLNTREKSAIDLKEHGENKVEMIREKMPEYKNKKIVVFYLNLYDNTTNYSITHGGVGIIRDDKDILSQDEFYDLGSLYYKNKEEEVILNNSVGQSIRKIIDTTASYGEIKFKEAKKGQLTMFGD